MTLQPGKTPFQLLSLLLGAAVVSLSVDLRAQAPVPAAPVVVSQPGVLKPVPRAAAVVPAPVNDPKALAADADEKTYTAKFGETNAPFVFTITNVSKSEVVIHSVRTSCGCTLAKLPAQPWHLAPGDHGSIEVNMDLRGKFGTIAKSVSIDANTGFKMLLVKSIIPSQPTTGGRDNMDRQLNMQMAMADRQVVFKGECASCHVTPAKGKMGKDLYVAACGICHDGEHRASMVPDLKALKVPTSLEYWKHSITHGKPNSLMPAFAQEYGGFLNAREIASIAEYLHKEITLGKRTAAVTPPHAVNGPAVPPVQALNPAFPAQLPPPAPAPVKKPVEAPPLPPTPPAARSTD